MIHPEDDEDPDEEGEDIGVGVDLVLQGELAGVGDDVEDPGLVGDSVQLGDEGEDCKAKSLLSDDCSGEGDDDREMMNREESEVATEDHVQHLSNMNTQAEHDQVDRQLGAAVHQVSAEMIGLVQRQHGPDSTDCCGQPRQPGAPVLVDPGAGGVHVVGDPGQQVDAPHQLEHWSIHQIREIVDNVFIGMRRGGIEESVGEGEAFHDDECVEDDLEGSTESEFPEQKILYSIILSLQTSIFRIPSSRMLMIRVPDVRSFNPDVITQHRQCTSDQVYSVTFLKNKKHEREYLIYLPLVSKYKTFTKFKFKLSLQLL